MVFSNQMALPPRSAAVIVLGLLGALFACSDATDLGGEGSGCSTDGDCKGDRVCVEQTCTGAVAERVAEGEDDAGDDDETSDDDLVVAMVEPEPFVESPRGEPRAPAADDDLPADDEALTDDDLASDDDAPMEDEMEMPQGDDDTAEPEVTVEPEPSAAGAPGNGGNGGNGTGGAPASAGTAGSNEGGAGDDPGAGGNGGAGGQPATAYDCENLAAERVACGLGEQVEAVAAECMALTQERESSDPGFSACYLSCIEEFGGECEPLTTDWSSDGCIDECATAPDNAQPDVECSDGAWVRCRCQPYIGEQECTPDLQQSFYESCAETTSSSTRCMAQYFTNTETDPGSELCFACLGD